mmetsp:Transcript_105689/g.182272  ORF Transcript_105689/g.182272 Transcript_105689/m.182272 type:complete len:273 (-) Transcript_105689:96-914(-)
MHREGIQVNAEVVRGHHLDAVGGVPCEPEHWAAHPGASLGHSEPLLPRTGPVKDVGGEIVEPLCGGPAEQGKLVHGGERDIGVQRELGQQVSDVGEEHGVLAPADEQLVLHLVLGLIAPCQPPPQRPGGPMCQRGDGAEHSMHAVSVVLRMRVEIFRWPLIFEHYDCTWIHGIECGAHFVQRVRKYGLGLHLFVAPPRVLQPQQEEVVELGVHPHLPRFHLIGEGKGAGMPCPHHRDHCPLGGRPQAFCGVPAVVVPREVAIALVRQCTAPG